MDELDRVLGFEQAKIVSPEAKKLANKLMGEAFLLATEMDDDWMREMFVSHRGIFSDILARCYQTAINEGKMEV